jgi:hypothetical protein
MSFFVVFCIRALGTLRFSMHPTALPVYPGGYKHDMQERGASRDVFLADRLTSALAQFCHQVSAVLLCQINN